MGRKPKDDLKGFLFIADHMARYGKQPSFQAIATELDYGSKRSVQLLIKRLVDKGRITYEKGIIDLVHKSEMVQSERTVRVPILGQVPAGSLEEAVEDARGYVDVSIGVAKPGSQYYVLQAVGNSMDKAGYDSGSLMLVRQQPTAENGDIVIAFVNGAVTVKRFRRDGDFVILTPESTNPDHKPMYFSEDFAIQGKVIKRLPDPYYYYDREQSH